ncbi:MAG: hypothetical protein ABWJ98_01195 [Hydrogenothermaceae bacterium]
MDKVEFLKHLKQKLDSSSILPDAEIEVRFFDENGKVLEKPAVLVRYYPTETDVREREIVISPSLYEKTVEDAYNFIVFQIEQFEEEIDSIEFSGE